MSARPEGKYQDHYVVLGIEPKSDTETIHRAYSELAAKYHPNNGTPDKERYKAVTDAYEVLADPQARAAFDAVRSGPEQEATPQFSGADFFKGVADEMLRRQALLCLLYDRRRLKPARPGLSMRQVEAMTTCSSDELQSSIWYLKQKGLMQSDDKSNVIITVQGMEFLESHPPAPEEVLPLLRTAAEPTPMKTPAPDPPPAVATPPARVSTPASTHATLVAAGPASNAADHAGQKTIVIPPRR